MKITLLTPNFPPEIGACSRRVFQLAESLQAGGHQVQVLTVLPNYPSGEFLAKDQSVFVRKESYRGIDVLRVRFWARRGGSLLPRFLSALSMSVAVLWFLPAVRAFRPDWIWVQAPPWPLPLSGLFLARRLRARLFINLSDLHPQALHDMGKLSRKSWLYRCFDSLAHYVYQQADGMAGQSMEIVSVLRKILPEKPVLLYRNGLAYEQLGKPGRRNLEEPFRWVYAGLLGQVQGVFDLIREVNFQQLGQELHIYGAGVMRRKIADFLTENPDRGIVLHTPVAADAVPRILQKYDGALIAQQHVILGTVPSKIYEAMAAGLPVLLLGGGESAELVRQSGGGKVVRPNDWEALHQALSELGNCTAADYNHLSVCGIRFAAKHFMHNLHYTAFEKLLANLQNAAD